MMKESLSLARKMGLHRVGLSVVADNKPAIRVYEKVGFQNEGVRKDSYHAEDGQYHDMVEIGIIL